MPNNIGVQVKLRKEIKENGIIVVLIPKSEYAGKIKGIVKDTSKIQGKLCIQVSCAGFEVRFSRH